MSVWVTNHEEWLHQNVQGVDVRTYDDDPTKYTDLRVGRIDAILVDRLAALDLVKKTNVTLAVTGEALSRQESGVALRKGNEDLLKAVNDAPDCGNAKRWHSASPFRKMVWC